jgi:hypothetical protein
MSEQPDKPDPWRFFDILLALISLRFVSPHFQGSPWWESLLIEIVFAIGVIYTAQSVRSLVWKHLRRPGA